MPIKLVTAAESTHRVQTTAKPFETSRLAGLAGDPFETSRLAGDPFETSRLAGDPFETSRLAGDPFETFVLAGGLLC